MDAPQIPPISSHLCATVAPQNQRSVRLSSLRSHDADEPTPNFPQRGRLPVSPLVRASHIEAGCFPVYTWGRSTLSIQQFCGY